MSVYSEYLEHFGGNDSQPNASGPNEGRKAGDYLKTGLLMRAVICLAFIATGAVYSLV